MNKGKTLLAQVLEFIPKYEFDKLVVNTQIWIAVSVYVLIAIIKKNLKSEHSFSTVLQKLSVCFFEKIPIQQSFKEIELQKAETTIAYQLNLF